MPFRKLYLYRFLLKLGEGAPLEGGDKVALYVPLSGEGGVCGVAPNLGGERPPYCIYR